jgi:hypothetical protein
MQYQDCAEAMQAGEDWLDDQLLGGMRVTDASINPATGLATDFLNHFNEAVMLLELLSSCPECIDDFLSWHPRTYREHFAASRFKDRDVAIRAYEAADPAVRQCIDTIADTMNSALVAAAAALRSEMPPESASHFASRAAEMIKPLIARAGSLINGETDGGEPPKAPQAVVDVLMKR